MRRSLISPSALALLPFLALATTHVGAADSGLISNLEAQRDGLVRAWFSQTQLDPTRSTVEHAVVDQDRVIVLTTAGVLHAMDAETGATAWITRLGNPDYPNYGPAVSDRYVAAINGSRLYVLKRENGLEVMNISLGGGPGGGPALTDDFVYVPLFNGRLEAHPLHDERLNTWYYASTGQISQSATATTDSVVWPTDRGYMYVANPAANGIRYRFEASGLLNDDPVPYDGMLLFSSSQGYVYAIDEMNGQQRWRYSIGASVLRSPLAIDGIAYVASESPALHAIDIRSGNRKWIAPGVSQVVSVSESRVYGITPSGLLMILDKDTGIPLGRLKTSEATSAAVNRSTDRLYLVSEKGLVQCLHEFGADEPHLHAPAPEASDQPVEDRPAAVDLPEQPAEEDQGDDAPPVDNPFAAPRDGGNPFGGNPFGPIDEEDPEPADDNPFGF